jgi:hypothetical protein
MQKASFIHKLGSESRQVCRRVPLYHASECICCVWHANGVELRETVNVNVVSGMRMELNCVIQ